MLKIQVLGRGSIPRGLGLAPRKEPFKADLLLIQTILASPCKFKVNMLHPITGKFVEVTNKNVKSLWDKYSDYDASTTPAEDEVDQVPENKDDKVEETKPEETVQDVIEDTKEDTKVEDAENEDQSEDKDDKVETVSEDTEKAADEDSVDVKTTEEEKIDTPAADDEDTIPVTNAEETSTPVIAKNVAASATKNKSNKNKK